MFHVQSVIVLLPLFFFFFFFLREKKSTFIMRHRVCLESLCGCASDITSMVIAVEDIFKTTCSAFSFC